MKPHPFILYVTAPRVHTFTFLPGLRPNLPRLVGGPVAWSRFYLGRLPLAVAHPIPPDLVPYSAKIAEHYFHGHMVIVAARPSSLGDGESFDGLSWVERNAVLRRLKLPALRFTWVSPSQITKPDFRIVYPIPYHALRPSP
jgi:hypothetical protein